MFSELSSYDPESTGEGVLVVLAQRGIITYKIQLGCLQLPF